jgi:hypothetical protein
LEVVKSAAAREGRTTLASCPHRNTSSFYPLLWHLPSLEPTGSLSCNRCWGCYERGRSKIQGASAWLTVSLDNKLLSSHLRNLVVKKLIKLMGRFHFTFTFKFREGQKVPRRCQFSNTNHPSISADHRGK